MPASGDVGPTNTARGACPGWIVYSGHQVGVLDADLALESVGIPEEQAEHRPEVGDEVVGRTAGHEPVTDGLEGLERGRLHGEMVEAATLEHRCLPIRLRVPLDLEDVEL